MIYTCKPRKVALYINTDRKTVAEIKAETGCDAILNGGLYDRDEFRPNCHLKVDGKVYVSDPDKYWGYGWSGNDLPKIMVDYAGVDNFICRTCLVREGKKAPFWGKGTGSAAYSAIGTFADGRLWIYCDHTSRDREEIQQIALDAGVQDAVLLDGGGSTQFIGPDGKLTTSRRNHNYILIWEEQEENEPTKESERPMFKIALGAGHGINTAGKRCMKKLDPNETREWWLNDRICDRVETLLAAFAGVEVLRLDDSDDGAENVALAERVAAANKFGADLYLSVHHNAGINGGSGGGIMAFTKPGADTEAVAWRDTLYDALIEATGLKGNRATPKATGSYYVLNKSNMPAVLLELGFMDSKTDVPIILTDDYAWKCAQAIVDVIVQRAKLEPKSTQTQKPWYADAQAWVMAQGISDGTRPDEPITRAEVWAMLYRALNK